MQTVYLLCFVIGLGLSVVLALAGGLHVGGHGHGASSAHGSGAHGHAHSAHGTNGHATARGTHGHATEAAHGMSMHAHGGGWSAERLANTALGFLSPLALAGAALLFGAAGLLLGSSSLALPIAILAGILGAVAVEALMNAFVRSSTAPLVLGAEGAIGTVNATIRPGASGEVLYTLEGLHRSVAARSSVDDVIPRGTQVVITKREGGIAWVEPLNPLDTLQKESKS